jgi:CD109 antigen
VFFFPHRLTAFVVKSFAQARKYTYVDPNSLDLSLLFMVRKQNKDGSFPKVGSVHGSYLKVTLYSAL